VARRRCDRCIDFTIGRTLASKVFASSTVKSFISVERSRFISLTRAIPSPATKLILLFCEE